MSPNSNPSDLPGLPRRRVQVLPYDPQWPLTFERLKAGIGGAVQGTVDAIEHVGSTSVPGLAAKPIIDIDLIVATRDGMAAVIERLAGIGYVHVGDLGIEDREAFEPPLDLPAHHLYACVRGCVALQNHLLVRDYLRENPPLAQAYGDLKLRLAEHCSDDPLRYSKGKTDFLLAVLSEAGCREEALRKVRRANLGA
ncbi:GrpB family protein [Dyella sp. 2RAB6]|uniref:GrpB family protein n=1 Tax=Dyella sp. 2RAB6 TaxID=3232992 RepID=UPI003F900FC6